MQVTKLTLRSAVIYKGDKWLVVGRPDLFQNHDLYNLAKPDARGVVSRFSERAVNVPGRELTAEVDCFA